MTPEDATAAAENHQGDVLVSMSGGKDSTATYLYLEKTGFLARKEAQGFKVYRVFSDTGWELPETYRYLDELEQKIGKIHRIAVHVPGAGEAKPSGYDHLEPVWKTPGKVMDGDRFALSLLLEAKFGRYSPMIRLILQWGKFPTAVRRWCTEETKKKPMVGFLATLNNPLNVIGVRDEESKIRASRPIFEWSEAYDAQVWRAISHFTLQDVIDTHLAAGITPNPLYLQGAGSGRVGCGPCVYSAKKDIQWLSSEHPERLTLLSEIEDILAQLGTDYESNMGVSPRWFILNKLIDSKEYKGKAGLRKVDWPVPVQEAVAWAHTTRGGKQYPLFKAEEAPGCAAWGLCTG